MVACNGRARDRTKRGFISATGRGSKAAQHRERIHRTVIERKGFKGATGRGHEGGAAPKDDESNNNARKNRQESPRGQCEVS